MEWPKMRGDLFVGQAGRFSSENRQPYLGATHRQQSHKKPLIFLVFFVALLSWVPGACGTTPQRDPLSSSAVGEEQAATENVLSLKMEECLTLAMQNNLEVAIERIEPQVAQQQIRGQKGAFDPQWKSTVQYEDQNTPLPSQASIAAGGLGEVEAQTLAWGTALEGKIPTGLAYRLGYDQNRADSTFNRFQSEYTTFTGLTLTQPLLKDFWLDNNLALVRMARRDHQISAEAFRLKVMDVAARVRASYWDLVFVIEDARVKKESLRLAADLLKENRKRMEVGVLSPLEVTQAEAGVAEREESVIVSERAVRDQENVLKRLIYKDLAARLDARLQPVDYPAIPMRHVDREECLRIALEKRPEFHQLKTELEKLQIQVCYTGNQRLPQVDLQGSFGLNGLDANPGSSFDNAWSANHAEWTIGAAVTVPLWNQKNESQHQVSQLKKKQLLARLKQTEQQIIVEVDNACGRVESNLKRVEATRASRKFAEEALAAEETKLKNGASTSHNVLDFQEALAKARSAEIQAVVDYNKTLNELSKAQGTLLDELKIVLDEK